MQMFEPADNIDLLAVVQEWEEYYEMRFARKPKLARDHVERKGRHGRHGQRGKAAGWPRLAGARGSLRRALALREASGEPAGPKAEPACSRHGVELVDEECLGAVDVDEAREHVRGAAGVRGARRVGGHRVGPKRSKEGHSTALKVARSSIRGKGWVPNGPVSALGALSQPEL